jgi:hypothetical protein
MDNTTIIVLGIYTLIYLIVFFVQKSQIDKQKAITDSMQQFINIFKVDEVVKYSDMRHETTMEKVKKVINEYAEKETKESLMPIVNKRFEETKTELVESMGDQFDELSNVVLWLLEEFPEKDKEEFMNVNLPKTKHLFQPVLEDLETDNNSSHPDNQ